MKSRLTGQRAGKIRSSKQQQRQHTKTDKKDREKLKKFFFRLSLSSSAGYLEFFSMSHMLVSRDKTGKDTFLYSISELKTHH